MIRTFCLVSAVTQSRRICHTQPLSTSRSQMSFVSALNPLSNGKETSFLLVFHGHKILLNERNSTPCLPQSTEIDDSIDLIQRGIFIGELNGIPCYAISLSEITPPFQFLKPFDLRDLITRLDTSLFRATMTASQILNWDRNFQFCGHCATPTISLPTERAKKCPSCGLVSFPRISPAVMIAVVKNDQLLLARGRNFPKGMRSVLAGFVEPGESLEESAKREVKEEVGIEIDDLSYFSSEFWPFPDSLMIAFTAKHARGEIEVDGNEIVEADWYRAGSLPYRPSSKVSISGRLIDWFEDTYG